MIDLSLKTKLKEPVLSWFVVMLLGKLALGLGQSFAWFASYSGLILSILLLYVPLGVYYKKRERFRFLDTSAKTLKSSFFSLFVLSGLVFFVSSVFVWLAPGFDFVKPEAAKMLHFLISQLVIVAFPEEFFFRGYFQERLNQVWNKSIKVCGVLIGPSLFVTSLIFALSHSFMSFQPWHILIFFPSLLFGFLREYTGSIWASVFFHAFCNLFSYLVVIH